LIVGTAAVIGVVAAGFTPFAFWRIAMGLGQILALWAALALLVALRVAQGIRATSVVLYPDRLEVRRREGGTTVPLNQITAVVVARAGIWATWLLLADGTEVRLSAPAHVFTTRMRSGATPDDDWWAELVGSPSGRQAELIFTHAARCQGPGGALTQPHSIRDALASSDSGALRGAKRWWSPTGERLAL
jgi:hypothetical protein